MLIKLTEASYEEAIKKAVDVLNNGGIVAYPTETFYALGVKYDLGPALKRLYELKQRPDEKAMPLIAGSLEQLNALADNICDCAGKLASEHWPGPLTLIFKAREDLEEYVVSNGKVAVRVPGESFALRLARATGFPITATSANISGNPAAENALMVIDSFGNNLDLIIDGGQTKGGLPSTIADVTENHISIVRKGAVDI